MVVRPPHPKLNLSFFNYLGKAILMLCLGWGGPQTYGRQAGGRMFEVPPPTPNLTSNFFYLVK